MGRYPWPACCWCSARRASRSGFLGSAPARAFSPALLAALAADLGIELRAVRALGRLATLLADLRVELGPLLLLHRLAALLPDLGIELGPVLLLHCLATMACLRRAGLWTSLFVDHALSPGLLWLGAAYMKEQASKNHTRGAVKELFQPACCPKPDTPAKRYG